MEKAGMILRYELRKCLSAIPTKNKVIEDESFAASLIDYQFLNALPFIYVHFKYEVQKLQLLELAGGLTSSSLLVLQKLILSQQFKMQQAFLRSQKLKYNQQLYSAWGQLPPNLLLPNTENVIALTIHFRKILYLNQINEKTQQAQLKLEWWGMQKPHLLNYSFEEKSEEEECIAKYVVCSSVDRLIGYFMDMKLLAIEVSIKNRAIGKSYLNFLILKGWKGQKYEGFLDIKHNNKKIGEITYEIEMKTVQHPFFQPPVAQQFHIIPKQKSFQPPIAHNASSNSLSVDIRTKHCIIDKEEAYKQENQQYPQIFVKPSDRNVSFQPSQYISSMPKIATSKHAMPQIFQKTKRYDPILEEEPVYRENKEVKYETQLIRLVEDYNLLFGTANRWNNIDYSSENTIQIEIIQIQLQGKEAATQIEVTLPLLDGSKNYYRLGKGGVIKLSLNANQHKNELINYLKNCTLEFKCGGKLQGSIKLSKILSRNGQLMPVSLYEREGKKQLGKKVKGNCMIKALPPVQLTKSQRKVEKEKQIHELSSRKQEKPIQVGQKEQYALFFIKKYNSLQKNRRAFNYCIRLLETKKESQLAFSKTIWNSQQDPDFSEAITCKVSSNAITIELYDRQKTMIKVGQGQLIMQSPLGINIQVPISTKFSNKFVVIGYLSIDYVKNGLDSVTKMMTLLNHNKENTFIRTGPLLKREQINQNNPNQLPIEPLESINQHQSTLQKENQHQQINVIDDKKENEQIFKRTENEKKQPRQRGELQRNLTLLEIHNKIFTYIHSKPSILQPVSEISHIKITQFLSLFEQLLATKFITHKEINLLISHYLFSSEETKLVNQIDIARFKESYQAFCTYYEESVQERDELLKELMTMLDDVGMTINDLEFQLRGHQVWEKMNDILLGHKNDNINIIEDIRLFYEVDIESKYRMVPRFEMTAAKFCDILRKFEVYQTTLGQEVRAQKLGKTIYHNICELLAELQPDIQHYSYQQLINFLNSQQIDLTSWEILNLQDYLGKQNRQTFRPIPIREYEHPYHKETKKELKKQVIKQPQKDEVHKQTIAKSPTFGYLHPQPQLLKAELMTSENQMVDSLAVKMHNLAISPINHNSTQSYNPIKAVFSNLKYQPVDLYVNDYRIPLNNERINSKDYQSGSHNIPSKDNYSQDKSSKQKSSKEREEKSSQMDMSVKNDYQSLSRQGDRISGMIVKSGENILIQLDNVDRNFTYKLQIHFQQEESPIQVECMHNEWAGLVSEEGDYLGGVLIY